MFTYADNTYHTQCLQLLFNRIMEYIYLAKLSVEPLKLGGAFHLSADKWLICKTEKDDKLSPQWHICRTKLGQSLDELGPSTPGQGINLLVVLTQGYK